MASSTPPLPPPFLAPALSHSHNLFPAADGSGDLEPDEMVPIIIEMSKGQGIDVTPEQCIEFAEIFDDDGNGVIDREEVRSKGQVWAQGEVRSCSCSCAHATPLPLVAQRLT